MSKKTLSRNPRSPFWRLRYYDPRTNLQVTRTSKYRDHEEALRMQKFLRDSAKHASFTKDFSVFDSLVAKLFGLDSAAVLVPELTSLSAPKADEKKQFITWADFVEKTLEQKASKEGWEMWEVKAFLNRDTSLIKKVRLEHQEERLAGKSPRYKLRNLEDVVDRIRNLEKFFADKNMLDVTYETVTEFIKARRAMKMKNGKPIAGPTINRDTTVLNNLYGFCLFIKEFKDLRAPYNSKIHKLKEPKPSIKIWLDKTKEGFKSTCNEMGAFNSFPLTLMTDIAVTDWTTGLRIEELLSLRVNQVQLKEGLLRLEDWTKNGQYRNVYIRSKEVLSIIQRNIKGKGSNDFVFSWVKGGNRGKVDTEIRYGAFQKAFLAVCKKADIKGQKIHNWRKTAVTVQMFAIDGLSETEIMVEMQWSDTRLLNSYLDRPLAVQLRRQHLERTAPQTRKSPGLNNASREMAYAL